MSNEDFKLGLEGEAIDEEIVECEHCGYAFSPGDVGFAIFEIEGITYVCYRCFTNRLNEVRAATRPGEPN